jgi:thymidylate kinase
MTAGSGTPTSVADQKRDAAPSDAASAGPPMRRFIVVSGCNGVGKSTVAQTLSDRLGAVVFHYPVEFVAFREEVALDTEVAALPRLLYYLGATLHLSDLVRQQLDRSDVICDRYLESPLSLLLAESSFIETDLDRICAPFEPYLCVPNLTLFLTADYETACHRIRERLPRRRTRVEQLVLESRDFFDRRERALRHQARKRGPVVELDTTRLSPAEMCQEAIALVERDG